MNKSKTWIEATVVCFPESFEAVSNFLFEIGSCGVEEGPNAVIGYFSGDHAQDRLKASVQNYLNHLRMQGVTVSDVVFRRIAWEDWSRGWRATFKPVRATSRVVVKPPWEDCPQSEDQIVIDIMPRMAFGTGSGILAIAAAKLGARHIVAVDTDEDAVENARENINLNGVADSVDVRRGSLDAVDETVFHLVLANLDFPTITRLLPHIHRRVQPDGRLIISGILATDALRMENVITASEYVILDMRWKGEWAAFVIRPA
ncbi:MAG: 50S ribosomal protein L11 methyltransferase [bacterium]